MTFGTDSSFVFCFRDAVSKTVSEMLFQKNYFQNAVSEKLFPKHYFKKMLFQKNQLPKSYPRKINLPKINLRSRRRVCFP